MENRTSFSLEKNLKKWKADFSTSNNFSSDNIDELESHLLEEINHLQSKGLNEEEAFWIAQKRLGSTKDLKPEYAKVNKASSYINQVYPYLKGIFMYLAFVALVQTIHLLTLYVAYYFGVINLQTVSVATLTIISLLVVLTFVLKYGYSKLKIKYLSHISFLIGLMLFSKTIDILVFNNLEFTNHRLFIVYEPILRNTSIFEVYFTGLLLLLVFVLSLYRYKKRQKTKIIS